MPADDSVDVLMQQLQDADPVEARKIARELELIWSRSGSPTMDLLLRQGRDAIEAGDLTTAIGHLSALTDHAPDFAEGWHMRAQAFFLEEEFGLAMADLQHALALNPRNFKAVFGMGLILEQTGRIDSAYDAFQAILIVYPAFKPAIEGRDRLEGRVSGSDI